MHNGKRTGRLLWRWRSNPLRRREDLVEAWIMLATWTVFVLGGTLVGVITARATDASLAQLRAERHAVSAVVAENTGQALPTAEGTSDRVPAKVRWTASDGSLHTGRAMLDSAHRAGAKVTVWTDDEGRLAKQPPTALQATAQAELLGALAALALGGVVHAAGRVARYRLDCRRVDEWGREWDRIGPRWQRKST